MKTYRDPKNPLRMGVCNFERVDEGKLFRSVLDFLGRTKGIEIKEEKEFPYCLVVEGECPSGKFAVVFDFVEGTEIDCDNKETLIFLENILK